MSILHSQEKLLPSVQHPVNIIFDTDMSDDCDDVGALAILASAHRSGTTRLAAVLCGTGDPNSAPCAWKLLRYILGANSIPVGRYTGSIPVTTSSLYTGVVANGTWNGDGTATPTFGAHVAVARQALANLVATGQKGTWLTTGFFTILADVLASPADGISALTGPALFSAAIERVVSQGMTAPGNDGVVGDYNTNGSISSTMSALAALDAMSPPIEHFWSTSDLGAGIGTLPPVNTASPISTAYTQVVGSGVARSSWDLIAALFATLGDAEGVLTPYLRRATLTFHANGSNSWSLQSGVDSNLGLHPLVSSGMLQNLLNNSLAAAEPPLALPGQVTGVTIGSIGSTGATVTWTTPLTGGAPASYKVEDEISGASSWVTASAADTNVSYVLTGLTASTAYLVRVTAVNATGAGTPSTSASFTTTATPAGPGQVTGLAVGTITASSVVLSWTAPATGGTVTGYSVTYTPGGGSATTVATGSTSTNYLLNGLAASTTYSITVAATNATGTGTSSSAVSATTSTGATSLLLDGLTNAPVLAVSTRKLRAAYSGAAIRVRRASDNTEQDIGFNGSGDLDTASLLSFAGSGDAFVKSWYNQVSGGVSFLQASTSAQPKIVAAGVAQLFKTGGKAAPIWSGSSMTLTGLTVAGTSQQIMVATNNQCPSSGSGRLLSVIASGQTADYSGGSGSLFFYENGGSSIGMGSNSTGAAATLTVGPLQVSAGFNGQAPFIRMNGTLIQQSGGSGCSGIASTASVTLGNDPGGEGWTGVIGEMIWQAVYGTSDLTTIEASQKAYWGTP